jgi:tripartite-type tricarboxylate transporter receptor subunit TctC
MAPTLYSKLPYDPGRDFTFVCGHWRGSYVLVVAPDFPARSLPELLALLRTHPGRYTYASPGPGTPQHIAAEMLKRQANVDMLHVPYRGGAPALLDLLAGRVDMLFDLINGPLQAAREGKVRVLAVLTQQRNPVLPEVPAAAEIVPGVAVSSWTLVCGPAGIPKAVVSRISDLTRQAMESPDIASRYRELGIEPWWAPGEPMAAFRAEEEARLAPVIRASGAHLD